MRFLLLALLIIGVTPAFADDLTLQRMILSSAGVGYFEYTAKVDGDATLGLNVPLTEVDDVLNSLVVFDTAGGVGTVELPGHDETHAAFGALPFGPAALRSPITYLSDLRVEVAVKGPQRMTGRNETVPDAPGRPPMVVPRTRVTLMSEQGLRQFVLEDAESVQVTNAALRADIDRALQAMRTEASRTVRHITLHSSGTGVRTVRVGYVVAAPLWKATYRLALPTKAGGKARLQGWAVLENQSGADWKGVALSLQYGNPVTFRQTIYRSYYVRRPEVPVEVLGRILPGVDTERRPLSAPMNRAPPGGIAGIEAPAPMARMEMAAPPALAQPTSPIVALEGVEETVFPIAKPVDLPGGQTASVPIIDHAVPAERVDLASGDDTHALSAVRITNDTADSLPAGVLALYDATGPVTFAGDARLGGLPVGGDRLLPFAQDLQTTVERQTNGEVSLASLTAAQGVLHMATRQRDVQRIRLTAPPNEARLVLGAIARDGDRTLTVEGGPVPGTEQTATAWRIPVSLRPGETRHLTVYLDRLEQQNTALMANDAAVVVRVLAANTLSGSARAALQKIEALRQDEAAKRTAVSSLQRQLNAAEQDEDRIRKNLAVVAGNDASHARLMHELDADEATIAQLAASVGEARAAADKAHQGLANAAANLRI
jgi:Domain of unknown function (DUF4139)